MAQERTGIVVGTNKGHVRLSPILLSSSLSRVSVAFGPFFRVEPSRVQGPFDHQQYTANRKSVMRTSTQILRKRRKRQELNPTRIMRRNQFEVTSGPGNLEHEAHLEFTHRNQQSTPGDNAAADNV
jgi:hypothetical protein